MEGRSALKAASMLLIDQKGARVRPVCRQHRYVGKRCPKCRAERSSRAARAFMSAVQEAKRVVAGGAR